MKKVNLLLIFFSLSFIIGCKSDEEIKTTESPDCPADLSIEEIKNRTFGMGFSTWSYGPDVQQREETYQFISENADVYSEQIDNKIPWDALMNNKTLPGQFVADIDYRVSKRIKNHKLLLSVSLLNNDRSDLLEDYDGTTPTYSALTDLKIENAYFKHLDYLISRFAPDYLVFAMEVNDLKVKSQQKWTEYKALAKNIRSRIKQAYPQLKLAESITLHNYFSPDVSNPDAFVEEITQYINSNQDFAAISFYPFFKGLNSKTGFQKAFDFLHTQVNKSIAFVETTHLAETLEVERLNLNITSDACQQKDYLETLISNADQHNYEFIIWWAFRDFDLLWETFPDEVKDLGKVWRDTGLLDQDGNERVSYSIWKSVLNR